MGLMTNNTVRRLKISVAGANELESIYRLRHDVYATELGQYESRSDESLPDTGDVASVYIAASLDGKLAGFVGITHPNSPQYSVDKFLSRDEIPLTFDDQLYEIRALTVKEDLRGFQVATCLMYAAFRWIESHGGNHIVAVGRSEVLDLYLRIGMKPIGKTFKCGAVTYDLMSAGTHDVADRIKSSFQSRLKRIEKYMDWQLGIAFHSPTECYHGGAFFDAIGDQFDDLNRRKDIISADVLDAWYPPAPLAQKVLTDHMGFVMQTSPPTRSGGLVKSIAEVRGVRDDCILTGGGSSALIFLAFRQWLNPSSRVLVLDPTYGEYLHVLKQVVKCKVERFSLKRSEGYQLNIESLKKRLAEGFDLFVWVNPNSPTGLHVSKSDVEAVLRESSTCKRVWIDETYIEYAGAEHSLESFAVQSENVIVCKSMSKIYALSGLRAAYLCASPHQLEELKVITPPWSVSLPAQIAATYALHANDYYAMRYWETKELREKLVQELYTMGITEIIPGIANFVMFHLPETMDTAESIVKKCRDSGLFLRNVAGMGSEVGHRAMRMAVKDEETNNRMLEIFRTTINQTNSIPRKDELHEPIFTAY
jgi:histidinol-phosphate/aromatic aminotransferase/cobyric acid decarboxylase-like protein/predicted GNAT family N-acyltransferase